MNRLVFFSVIGIVALSGPAMSQTVRPAQPGDIAVIQQSGSCAGGLGDPAYGTCLDLRNGIDPSSLAGASSIAALQADMRAAEDLAVIAATVKDAIPNSGDLYAASVNLGTNGSSVAGAISVGVVIGDHGRFNLNWGTNTKQHLVTGGFTISMK